MRCAVRSSAFSCFIYLDHRVENKRLGVKVGDGDERVRYYRLTADAGGVVGWQREHIIVSYTREHSHATEGCPQLLS